MEEIVDKIYSWNINALETNLTHEGKNDVIFTIHWTYVCTEGDLSVSNVGTYSPIFDSENFIEFEDVKKENVISWLEENLNIEELKLNLNKQIGELKTPTTKSYNNPFEQSQ
jgi:hypothetical protein